MKVVFRDRKGRLLAVKELTEKEFFEEINKVSRKAAAVFHVVVGGETLPKEKPVKKIDYTVIIDTLD